MRRSLPLAALLAILPAALAAQPGHGAHHAAPAAARQAEPRPAGWTVRYDRANAVDSTLVFVAMDPGWHVTTGPSGILYDPARTAAGAFRVESEMFLFPGERAEGFGILVGGAALDGDAQRYTYFLLRRSGEFLVRRRQGSATRDLLPWTAHAAIPKHQMAEGTVRYVLGVDATEPAQVHFTVNGERVASLPRADVAPDGIVGLRVNHALDLHVTSLAVRRP